MIYQSHLYNINLKMDESQLLDNADSVKGEQAYKKIKVLGEGSMGKAYLVQSNFDHQFYVMKRINIGHLNPEQRENAMREAQLHSIVSHPNIIAFKQIYHTTKDKLCIIMEYAEGGDLDQLIQQQKDSGKFMTEECVLNYFTQICLGLRKFRKIIHRDIKGANIFLAHDRTVKIGDFGISKVIDQTVQASKSFVGTPYYLSPQMVEGKPYSTKADIWAVGVLLYQMCCQKLPFEAHSLPLLALKILKGSFPPLAGPYSKDLKNLIVSMLQVDAKKRPSAIDILRKPVLAKYLPNQEAEKLESLKEKPKIQKTVPNMISSVPHVHGQSININTLKSDKKSEKKAVEEDKKQKEQEMKEEKRKKRIEDFKTMREDIRQKRNQLQKEKTGTQAVKTTQQLELPNPPTNKITSKKITVVEKSPVPGKVEEQKKKEMQKPWKMAKGKQGKKQVEVEILVPALKEKTTKEDQSAPLIDFNIEIKQFGRKPPSYHELPQDKPSSSHDLDQAEKQQSETNEQHQDQEIEESYEESEELDYRNMMNHLNNAQAAVKGLNFNIGREIELYEESENFDDAEKIESNAIQRPQTPKMPEMNPMEKQSWNFIHNSDNLEECRQILEDGLGQERFMKAYHILSEHLEFSEQKKLRGDELEDYTFNREVLRQKLEFLTDQEFNDYLVLMYTLIVIEIEEMKKNLGD